MKSIVQTGDDRCFRRRMAYGSDTHHIFGGPNRSLSDQDGLTVRLCRQCHDYLHCDKRSGDEMRKLKQLGQTKWEAYYGPKLEQQGKDPREKFIKRHGRNYL